MIRSTDRILTMHAGTLPRPTDLRERVMAKSRGEAIDEAAFTKDLQQVIGENVKKQIETGIDSVNDGELSKSSFSNYMKERLGGLESRPADPNSPRMGAIGGRDLTAFAEYFETGANRSQAATGQNRVGQTVCVGPITYIGQKDLQADIDNFNVGLKGSKPNETFLPAITPGTVEHWLKNEYYKTTEEFLFAVADALAIEYKSIVDAGFLLQIDDPDLPDAWQIHPDMTVPEYRKFAQLRVDALNHALKDIPEESIRFHTCWGSYHGPHQFDIPLADIVDIILNVKAVGYSIEASNPRHDHEWTVWKDAKLMDGKVLIPGVIGHSNDFIEHPELVAQRLVRYANIVGKENVMAGTDCGIGSRVGHAQICWAKFQAMSEGAAIASKELWG
jgi:5-methyltetrahydropteroyltriglutamate--homocysteine methyltransferase